MTPQVLHMKILPQAHLMVILTMLVHAQAMMMMLLQALQLHHIALSQGDTKVSNANVIDLDSYEELLDRYCCMIKALEKRWPKPRN